MTSLTIFLPPLRRNPVTLCTLLILSGFLPINLSAQGGLTPEQTAKIKSVTGATLSEDGNRIAYTVAAPADPFKENRPASIELHLLDRSSGETRPFYTSGNVAGVSFRPGHNSVTFLTRTDGDSGRAIYEMPLDGGEATRLFSFRQNIISYAWASDGNRLAFTAPEEMPHTESKLPYRPEIYEENRPNRRAYIVDLNRQEAEPLQLEPEGTVYMLEWSPDNRHLAITATPTPAIDDYYMFQQVLVVDTRSGEVTATIESEGKIGQIEWSPDGSRLALRAGQDIHDPIDGRIQIVSSSGGRPRIIDSDFEGKYEQIAWSSRNEIHFLASEGVWNTFGTIRPDGGDKRKVIGKEGPVLLSFNRSADGTTLFTCNSTSHPTEICLLDEGEQQPVRTTHTNPWLEGVELGRQEVIRYPTRDGRFEIEGVLIYPVDDRAGAPLPLITVIHGGPEAHYSNGWLTSYSMPGQMAAATGYAVFYPNYRGSTGRGIDFVYSSQGDAAGREFDDVVDGVDYLIENGIADSDRVGVTGGSYGGYASGWMATYYSDRFAASVMFVGVSNNISKWGTSDIPEELYLVHARERIWDGNWMKYLERSPIYHVDRADTPILILHGSEDTRVHPAQSMELYRHLKVRRPEVPLRLIYYPNEGHGNASATARYDYSLRMMRWFDTYLKSGDRRATLPERDPELPGEQAPLNANK